MKELPMKWERRRKNVYKIRLKELIQSSFE